MKLKFSKRLLLGLTASLFFPAWAWLSLVMLMTWAFIDLRLNLYGFATCSVLLYGGVTLAISIFTFFKPDQLRERLLWVLYLLIPVAVFALLELIY